MEKFWEATLGTQQFRPSVNAYREKLRSAQTEHTTRKTPRFLRTIVTPDDNQDSRLQGNSKDTMAVLKWTVVKEYAGSIADALKESMT
jgi:hypothetical protein